jgi:hypothetical protein
MTDLEMTKLCAEAMEEPPTLPGVSSIWGVSITYVPENKTDVWIRDSYRPLHDDAQAMALVKKFQPDIEAPFEGQPNWVVVHEDGSGASPDLNRAICECVAKMQQAKET